MDRSQGTLKGVSFFRSVAVAFRLRWPDAVTTHQISQPSILSGPDLLFLGRGEVEGILHV